MFGRPWVPSVCTGTHTDTQTHTPQVPLGLAQHGPIKEPSVANEGGLNEKMTPAGSYV